MTQAEFKELTAKANTGDTEAQFWIGRAYEDGQLVPKDSDEAMQWFLKSAEQGYVPAQRMYGLASVSVNPAVGERWMLRAGEQGDAEAQFCLGWAYEEDWFGTIDSQEALKWYRKAAEGGHPDAQVELGRRYEEGEGVEKNYALAAKWYRKAAEHVPNLGGAGQGSYRLGLLYTEGLGVPQDFTQAYFWFSLHGNAEANASDARKHLTPAQISEVERLLEEWKEQHRLDPAVATALHIEN
jgi:TPR repeat protein